MSNGPTLAEGQYAVLLAEVETGILLAEPGLRSKGGAPKFHVFDSHGSATGFADEILRRRPDIECILFDSSGRPTEEKRDVERLLEKRATLKSSPRGLWGRLFGARGKKR